MTPECLRLSAGVPHPGTPARVPSRPVPNSPIQTTAHGHALAGPVGELWGIGPKAFGRARRPVRDSARREGLRLLLQPGTQIGARYRVVRHLGSGAMGHVFEVEDLVHGGEAVALKL